MPSTRSVEGGPKRRTARFHLLAGLLGAASALAFLAGPAAAADCRAAAAPSIDWQDCNKSNLILRESPLAGANLFGTDLSYSDLRNSDLTGADLEKATLTRASLAGSKADGAKFHRIEGYRTLFNEISATGSSFASAELQRADFSGAKLDGANFEKAELGRGVFTGASIGGVKFTFANLARARFDGATFEQAAGADRCVPVPDAPRRAGSVRLYRPPAGADRPGVRRRQDQASAGPEAVRRAGRAAPWKRTSSPRFPRGHVIVRSRQVLIHFNVR